MDYAVFERRMLRLIFRSSVPLTPVHIAFYLDLPVAEARRHLEAMVSSGILELDSDDQGRLLYAYPMRPPASEVPELPAPSRRRRRRRRHAKLKPDSQALVPVSQAGPLIGPGDEGESRYSPAAAAALSMFLPGVGQIYSGRVPQGIGWLLATGLGYLLFLVPGLILHICCVVNAAAVPTAARMLPQPAR